MVQIRLLGGVSAATDQGEPVDLGPAKCQAVLAALALSAGAAVPVTRLVELVWGTEPPRTAEKTLQSYVTRLRKSLGPESIARYWPTRTTEGRSQPPIFQRQEPYWRCSVMRCCQTLSQRPREFPRWFMADRSRTLLTDAAA